MLSLIYTGGEEVSENIIFSTFICLLLFNFILTFKTMVNIYISKAIRAE